MAEIIGRQNETTLGITDEELQRGIDLDFVATAGLVKCQRICKYGIGRRFEDRPSDSTGDNIECSAVASVNEEQKSISLSCGDNESVCNVKITGDYGRQKTPVELASDWIVQETHRMSAALVVDSL